MTSTEIKTILCALISENKSLENCGIVNLYDEMSLGDFIRHYFCSEYHDYTIDGFNFVAPMGEDSTYDTTVKSTSTSASAIKSTASQGSSSTFVL